MFTSGQDELPPWLAPVDPSGVTALVEGLRADEPAGPVVPGGPGEPGGPVDALVVRLQALELQAARVWVRQGEVLLELWDLGDGSCRTGPLAQAVAEAAVALGLHERTVEARLQVAASLQVLPWVQALVLTGRLGVPHVVAMLDELAVLGGDLLGPCAACPDEPGEDRPVGLGERVARHVLTSQGRIGWDDTPGRLRTATRRAIALLDPQGTERRRAEQLAEQSGVRWRALPGGLARLAATGAAVQLRAALQLLDTAAGKAGPDDERTRGQRQVDALVGALVAQAGRGVPVEVQLDLPVQVTHAQVVVQDGPLEPVVIRTDLDAELLALLTGHTPPPPSPAQLRPVPVEPVPVEPDPGAAVPLPAERAASLADVPPDLGPPDGCRRRWPREGVDELYGHGPVDPGLLRDLLADPHGLPVGLGQVLVRRVCTDPLGQVVAVDARAVPLHRLLDRARTTSPPAVPPASTTGAPPESPPESPPGSPPGPAPRHRHSSGEPATARQLLHTLTSTLPTPPPALDSYRPSADQTRVVRARDQHCTWPGCSTPAQRCEIDHRTPHPHGPTSTANEHPLCQHHHRLKHDGWTCTRDQHGHTTWTSPLGQTTTRTG